jgi:acyl-CoA reductase-like NAD-dependent aldehyde dehydrogenase
MVFGDADIENAVGGAMACRLAFSQGDLACAHQMIAELQAGTCRINSYNLTLVEVPFGGFKQSGSPRSITTRS